MFGSKKKTPDYANHDKLLQAACKATTEATLAIATDLCANGAGAPKLSERTCDMITNSCGASLAMLQSARNGDTGINTLVVANSDAKTGDFMFGLAFIADEEVMQEITELLARKKGGTFKQC